jgi:hypothetical protein
MDGFEFSGQGKLNRVDTFTTKAGKNIFTLVIEVSGQYPQLVPIKIFGRLADRIEEWQEGDTLTFTGRLGGRDWQGKVFGEIVANTVEMITTGQRSGGGKAQHREEKVQDSHPEDDTDVPF